MSSSAQPNIAKHFSDALGKAMGAMGMSGGSAPSPLGSAPFGQNGGTVLLGGNADYGASKGGILVQGGSRRRRSRRRSSKRHSRRRQRGGVMMSPPGGGGRSRRLKRHSGKARRHRTRSYSAGGRRK